VYTDDNVRLFKFDHILQNKQSELRVAFRNDLDDTMIKKTELYLHVVRLLVSGYKQYNMDAETLMYKRIKLLEEIIAAQDYVDNGHERVLLLEIYRSVKADYSDLVVTKPAADKLTKDKTRRVSDLVVTKPAADKLSKSEIRRVSGRDKLEASATAMENMLRFMEKDNITKHRKRKITKERTEVRSVY